MKLLVCFLLALVVVARAFEDSDSDFLFNAAGDRAYLDWESDADFVATTQEEAAQIKASLAWSRSDCEKVANSWLAAKVKYNWSPTTNQYVTSGPGKYRSDCSGFVSAAWNHSPPGYTTRDIPITNITKSSLTRCDAFLRRGSPGHIALFWGWSGSNPIVVEECGHTQSCCTTGYTCPGSCGSASKCNEYCPGCPIQKRVWPASKLSNYNIVRRKGW